MRYGYFGIDQTGASCIGSFESDDGPARFAVARFRDGWLSLRMTIGADSGPVIAGIRRDWERRLRVVSAAGFDLLAERIEIVVESDDDGETDDDLVGAVR